MLEKELELKELLQTATFDHSLPGERAWRAARWQRNFESRAPSPYAPSLSTLTLMVYTGLRRSEALRREKFELFCLLKDTVLHAAKDRALTAQEVSALHTMLWDVHRTTNPSAIKPQDSASDSLAEDMKRNEALFNAPIKVIV